MSRSDHPLLRGRRGRSQQPFCSLGIRQREGVRIKRPTADTGRGRALAKDAGDSWIATEHFEYAPIGKRRKPLVVRIAAPTLEKRDGTLSAYGMCRIQIKPLLPEQRIGGENQFQALCLAIEHIRQTFRVLNRTGHTVYWRSTNNVVDPENPWFCPLPSLDDLAGKPRLRRRTKKTVRKNPRR
jgi:hypothetical protein